ncbi:hypothetical protein T4B_8276 [Trichinella pseudospiralis]|uniref:Uncharacterized protein n=1 Tax=Trichinella pseudospiralis TaxID=6337 RepID=A0A0V1IX59_TRIPS|nr:hypothetical protein T4B_8276 [Trichinella pseudospiralis]
METGGKGSKVINHVRYTGGDQNQQPRRPDYNAPRSRNERQTGGTAPWENNRQRMGSSALRHDGVKNGAEDETN